MFTADVISAQEARKIKNGKCMSIQKEDLKNRNRKKELRFRNLGSFSYEKSTRGACER